MKKLPRIVAGFIAIPAVTFGIGALMHYPWQTSLLTTAVLYAVVWGVTSLISSHHTGT